MKNVITVSILREDPSSGQLPYREVFKVMSERDMTVLEALQEIRYGLDTSLAYRRYRCGRKLCGSCEVKLDGRIVRACATLLSPGKTYLIEPARSGAVIRDLVCDFDSHFDLNRAQRSRSGF